MNGYNFSNAVRGALGRARIEASLLGHDHVGPTHILLGLMFAVDDDTETVLRRFQLGPSMVTRALLERVKRRDHVSDEGHDLPYSNRGKKVLELAMAEVSHMQHTYFGGAHVLLGIIGEVKDPAAETLVELGVTLDGARAELRRVVGDMVAINPEWRSELGTLTRQLADSLADVKNPRHAEDLLLVVASDPCGARHLLEVAGVNIDALQREIHESAGAGGVRELLAAAKGEQKFLEDCALASHHILLAYLALRPAHGYRALSERGVTHTSLRKMAELIFG